MPVERFVETRACDSYLILIEVLKVSDLIILFLC